MDGAKLIGRDGESLVMRGTNICDYDDPLQEAAGQMKPGMYVITDGTRQQKVMIK